jgi:hypothetical protein
MRISGERMSHIFLKTTVLMHTTHTHTLTHKIVLILSGEPPCKVDSLGMVRFGKVFLVHGIVFVNRQEDV